MNFKEIKEEYNELREQERIKIVNYFNSKGFKVSKAGGKGLKNYTNGGRIKSYDLSNWKWIEFKVDRKKVFVSLQAFDQDKSSKNFHVLMDRIGVCVIKNEEKEYFNTMETTEFDLPLSDNDLSKLFKIIEKKLKDK